MKINFEGRIVGVTGYSKNNADYHLAVARIIELEGGEIVGDFSSSNTWEIEQLILIGEEDFNKDYLIESIEVGKQHNFVCKYISLDDFWDYYQDNGYFEPYFEGDPRIENHAGLSFLASLYFEYPTVDILGFSKGSSNGKKDWNPESILKERFGYSVRQGVSQRERRNSLERAVKSPKIITLKQIADHIVFSINLRKGQKSMNPPIRRWAEDLEWLKEEFYNPSIHSFKFPQPD